MAKTRVTIPVFVTVGPVELRLFPYEWIDVLPDDSDEKPWAWGALCRVTFHFGRRVTTKRVTARYAFHGPGVWARQDRPSESELTAGREACSPTSPTF